ncbi:glycoside hydrolase family 3 N-terminal domain-containing protein [Nonlabens xiamenensis]|uniref:glycoside hydrolase family 3 N-terminal domain-containing protein n=1 Tax=Nonlabens xiamenensis TaxID=2341043 RepID=UPI0013DE673C|nr:glycoside hydrolase family 3 N-terminal domain-containing protein [Nonlabens xiamenensis]
MKWSVPLLLLLVVLMAFGIRGCATSETHSMRPPSKIDQKVNQLLSEMTLEEKIGQLNLRGTSSRTKVLPDSLKQAVREGHIGAFLNVMNSDYVKELQTIAVEESPHGIPLIFARDVIHGFKTIFPIPLGLAASWDQQVVVDASRVSAVEASAQGIRWTFAPMLDISRDARWGRIAESPGEDPYLASVLAQAYIQGFQGDSLNDPTAMAACAKHFIGYGAALGGRDYNTATIDEAQLRNVYLPPFQAALNAGAPTVMTSFNEVNGVPASGDEFLLDQVLRKEMQFDGFVVSDWNSVLEMINHGFAADQKQAAELAVNAGLDMEMTSRTYESYLMTLIEEGKVNESQIDFLVANILRVKFQLGLFERPFIPAHLDGKIYSQEHLQKAKNAAIKSSVLLKNNNQLLPLEKNTKIALIGPLAHQAREQLGTWTFDGEAEASITPLMALEEQNISLTFVETLSYSRDKDKSAFTKAVKAAQESDVIVFIGGEEAILSGEAHSRASLNLPGAQEDLISELAKTGKPIVGVIMAGRPITINTIKQHMDAILMAWHPGTMSGPAIYEMLFGLAEPGGRLPVTWPKTSGQLPLFYNHKNTGRPVNPEKFVQMDSIPVGAWQSSLGNTSHYLDVGYEPEFPFGYGLGYSRFSYGKVHIDKTVIKAGDSLRVSVELTNIGDRKSHEVVQLYIRDQTASLTRPVKELKAFQHIDLDQGSSTEVVFWLKKEDLAFVNRNMEKVTEPGLFNLWVGADSSTSNGTSFTYE